MRRLYLFVWTGLLVLNSAYAHEPKFSDRTDILHIIESFSQRTGVKFVTDPRVKARVNMVSIDIDDLSQTNLMDIFIIHGFTAYEREGVVYVLPQAAADHLGSKVGRLWSSE